MPLNYPSLDAAIGVAEGYGRPGAIPTLANNPGDIVFSAWSVSHGAIGSMVAGNGQLISTFPTAAMGTAAEDALIGERYSGGTIADLSSHWLAGSSPAQQASWANTVAKQLGLPTSTPVSQTEGASAGSGSGPTTCSWLDKLGGLCSDAKTLGDAAAKAQVIGGQTESTASIIKKALTAFSFSRVAAFALGLIFILGALYLFKPEAVHSAVRTAATAAVV